MGDGLKRAALATLRTRSWRVWSNLERRYIDLTGDQVVAAYEAIRDCHDSQRSVGVARAIGEGIGSGRRWDRTARLLKKAGLICYNRATRTWEAL